MRDEEQKAKKSKEEEERDVFAYFLKKLHTSAIDTPDNLQVGGSIESQKPPHPDILYTIGQRKTAFELFAACSPRTMREISEFINKGTDAAIIQTSVHTAGKKLKDKFAITYVADCPIELLIYANFLIDPDEHVVDELKEIIQSRRTGQFSRIWFCGDDVYCIYTK